jgi:hypothetical protein
MISEIVRPDVLFQTLFQPTFDVLDFVGQLDVHIPAQRNRIASGK